MTTLALWPGIRSLLERHRPSKLRSRSVRRSGAKQTRSGLCAVFQTCFMSITAATSRASILSKWLWTCTSNSSTPTIARPQGRGKIERLFGTLNTELLPELPGYLKHGKTATEPKLSLAELDRALGTFLVGTYNPRVHREIRVAPQAAWSGNGWLSRMPNSLEDLDLLLISVAKARTVHRDGIHF